jgi:hypothetical protein
MRRLTLIAALLAATATPSLAQDSKSQETKAEAAKEQAPDKPITEREPSVGDVAATPVEDLGIKKHAIPPLLIAAQGNPYNSTNLRRCPQIAAAVGELDAVLGRDVDLPQQDQKVSAGRAAKEAIGAFIPFRGLIRELSGANAHERRVDDAIEAGMVRRAYLKGLGEARGCNYPARSAGPKEVAAAQLAMADAKAEAKADDKPAKPKKRGKKAKDVEYVAQPVVQATRSKK